MLNSILNISVKEQKHNYTENALHY